MAPGPRSVREEDTTPYSLLDCCGKDTMPEAQGSMGEAKSARALGAAPLPSVNDPRGLSERAFREHCGLTGFVGLSLRSKLDLPS